MLYVLKFVIINGLRILEQIAFYALSWPVISVAR